MFRGLVLTGIWCLFTGWSVISLVMGLPIILAALIVTRYLPALPVFAMRPVEAAHFLLYFSRQSILGGVDVAWRALHPRIPLAPGFVEYQLRLTNDFAAMFFANTVSMLPGTLSVDLRDKQVTVHALDRNQDIRKNLRLLEQRVAELFGEDGRND